MECTLDPCQKNATISASVTCGEETQQIVANVFARIYSVANPGSAGNLTCNSEVAEWANHFEGSSQSCDVSAAVLSKCEGEADCSVSIDSVLGNCAVTGPLAMDLVIECGNAGTDPLTIFVLLMLFMVAIAMGTVTEVENFREIVGEQKKAFFIGFASQFGFMPLFSYVMAQAMGFSNLESVGIVLCGCAPGGSTSNLFTYWAGGNVPLSIAMSAASTLASFFMLPILWIVYVKSTFAQDLDAELPWSTMAAVLLTILIPVAIGMWLRAKHPNFAWYIEKLGGAFGVIFLIVSLIFGIIDNQKLFDLTIFWKSWLLGSFFQPLGCIFGYTVARFFDMEYRDAAAIALETGVQNYAVSLAVVVLSIEGCDRAEALTFVLTAMAFYLVHSPIIVMILLNYVKWKRVIVWPEKLEGDMDKGGNFWWTRQA